MGKSSRDPASIPCHGAAQPSEELTINPQGRKLRYVTIDILSNHRGVHYPANVQVKDNGFVGLAEVQFLNANGEHHANPALGTAWTGQFQNGPNPGPPPGHRYSTVAYRLFEPFVLQHRIEQ